MFSPKKLYRKAHSPAYRLTKWAVNIGTEGLQSPEREHTISVNQFTLIALTLTLAFQLYYLLFEFTLMLPVILVHTVATGIYLLALYISSRGNFLLAACIALAGPLFFQVPAVCYIISAEAGMHVFFLAGGIFTFIVFSDNHKHFRLGFIIISLIFFIVIERYFSRDLALVKLSDEMLNSMVYLNAIGTSVMIYLLASASHRMIVEQADQIRTQAHSLDTLANTDSLTQLPNRRQILSSVKNSKNGIRAFTGVLAIADIDHFKIFNDQYGHDCGDEILLSVARIMAGSIREKDIVGRWGGEEFIFLLADTTMSEAESILQRLRLSIERTPIPYRSVEHHTTVSIGATELGSDCDFNEAFKLADSALYQCKQNGRNCFLSN